MPHSKLLSQVFQVGFWYGKKQVWSTHRVDWEDDHKNKDNLKNEDDLKNEDNLKIEGDLKNWPCPPNIFSAPILSPYKILLKFSWWLLTLTATRQLMSNRICYQMSKPKMEFHLIDIIYAALSMRTQTEKTTFSCKDDFTYILEWSKGHVHWRSTHGTGHIPLCSIFKNSDTLVFNLLWF